MKSKLFLIVAASLFLSGIAYAQTQRIGGDLFITKKVIVLDESQNGSEVQMYPGQTISIQLEESAGFIWNVLDFDSKVLQELEPLCKPLSKPGEARRGMRVIGFDAKKPGKSSVHLGYVDPAHEKEPAKGFNLEIEVESIEEESGKGISLSVSTSIRQDRSTLDKWEGEDDGKKAGYPFGYKDGKNGKYMGYTDYEPPSMGGNEDYLAGYREGWEAGYRKGYSVGWHEHHNSN